MKRKLINASQKTSILRINANRASAARARVCFGNCVLHCKQELLLPTGKSTPLHPFSMSQIVKHAPRKITSTMAGSLFVSTASRSFREAAGREMFLTTRDISTCPCNNKQNEQRQKDFSSQSTGGCTGLSHPPPPQKKKKNGAAHLGPCFLAGAPFSKGVLQGNRNPKK